MKNQPSIPQSEPLEATHFPSFIANPPMSVKLEVSSLEKLLKLANKVALIEGENTSATTEWLRQVRHNAATWVGELALPTRRDEDWRFTDVSPLLQVEFAAATATPPKPVIEPLQLPEAAASRIVFVNGIYAPDLSSVDGLPAGVFAGNLSHLPASLQERISHYLTKQPGSQEVFTALNTAALADAAIVWVSKNQDIATPIHLLFISTVGNVSVITHPRCLVVAESGSAVTLVEHYATAEVGCPDTKASLPYFTNAVTEVWVEENASVTHARVQRDAGAAFHIGKTAITQARHSRYACHAVCLGAKLSRHNLEVFQTGEGTETTLNGLTLIGNEQVADTHSAIILNHPHGVSRQAHKCIVDHKAHAVFNGRVVVSKAAQLTDASQLSRNLLLSSKARVDTKPQLEIVADNVKCSHGATVSQLDEDEVFYLRSRGLNEEMSRHLLIDAFAAEILHQLPVDSLTQMLSRCVACRTE